LYGNPARSAPEFLFDAALGDFIGAAGNKVHVYRVSQPEQRVNHEMTNFFVALPIGICKQFIPASVSVGSFHGLLWYRSAVSQATEFFWSITNLLLWVSAHTARRGGDRVSWMTLSLSVVGL